MSITVKTGKTTSDYFAVTKTITNETQRTISLVYPCDMLAPTVSIKGGRIDANYLTGLFGRKYWITNQTVDKGITYLHCSVDAWASWASDIYGKSQFVARSEKHGNSYINDTSFPNTANIATQMQQGTLLTQKATYVIGVI
jgi:hypothetical protein